MKPKEYIEKAIEGGWRKGIKLEYYSEKSQHVTLSRNGMHELTTPIETILLDKNSWEAVGKTEKWVEECSFKFQQGFAHTGNCKECIIQGWKKKMNGLMPHLQEGGSIETYLETL